MSDRPSVAIIGAGVGGLSAGIALAQAGHEVTIFERHDELHPLGGAILLNAIGIHILRGYGVDVGDIRPVDSIEFRRCDGHRRVVQQTEPELSRQAGVDGWISGMMRSELYSRMLAVVPEGMIVTGRELVAFSEEQDAVTLRFADGSEHVCELLIGADGITSTVRETLWGESELKEMGIDVWLGWTENSGLPRNQLLMRHDRHVQLGYAPLMYDGLPCIEWWFVERHQAAAAPDPVPYILDRIRRFEQPVKDLVAATLPEHLFRWPVQHRDPLGRWSRGRVTLLGDACHPTSPYAGYGAGMAIEDGFFLGRVLRGRDLADGEDVASALQDYDDQRVAYTNRVTTFARGLGDMFHNASWPRRVVRDFMLDHTKIPERRISDGYQKGAHYLLRSMLDAESVGTH